MRDSLRQIWGNRFRVAQAAFMLALAELLIRKVRFPVWRGALGRLEGDRARGAGEAGAFPVAEGHREFARRAARRVERAARRVPCRTRCFSRAIAVKWLLDRARIPSRLVVAIHRTDRTGEDAYHAWVELRGEPEEEFVIGHCDRACYQPIMMFTDRPRELPALRPKPS